MKVHATDRARVCQHFWTFIHSIEDKCTFHSHFLFCYDALHYQLKMHLKWAILIVNYKLL